ncbi:MAG: glycosyltransferase family 4 protein [Ruminococcaceae bacterium]|nr:glycosyltransferase family 4 protein [Oscillospiraceae bacterium]
MSESRLIKNKRILVLANFDMGLYKFRKALLKELIRMENEVYIALPEGEFIPELEKLGCCFVAVELERRGMNPLRDIRLYRKYLSIVKLIRPDLVIAYTIKPNIYGGLACRKKKVPFVSNITGLGSAIEGGGLLRRLVLAMYKTGLKNAKIIFFENEGNRDMMVKAGAVKKDNTRVLRGAGVDTNEYPLLPYPKENTLRFLFVGRIMKEKGVEELFEAMIRLKADYGDNVILDVVGLFEESYQLRINTLQADGIINFHGYQTDIKQFYETAHCVVLPSYHEGMSNVLLEAASCGRPVITSNINGCMEAVENDVTGYLCEVRDEESLYSMMKRFCNLSPEERETMGKAGRERMIALFDKTMIVKITMDGMTDGLQRH